MYNSLQINEDSLYLSNYENIFKKMLLTVLILVSTYKYIKIIYYFIFKKLFLILTHQNNLKIQKKY